MLENEYIHNRRFRDYVNKYCAAKKITVKEALTHELIRQVFLCYTEV